MTRSGLVLVVLLAALAIWESAFALFEPRGEATEADWQSAEKTVRASFQPGDLIVFAPAWADPIGRQHLGDLMPLEMVARADADRYRRIFEVSLRGGHAPEVKDAHRLSESTHGRVHLALYEKGAVAVAYDFTSHLGEASVSLRSGGEEKPCLVASSAAFACPGGEVERRTFEVDYQPRRGILVPVQPGKTTVLDFDHVGGGLLVGYTGMNDYYARKNAQGLVDFHVLVDGHERLKKQQGNAGWNRFEIDLSKEPGSSGSHDVRFEISSLQPAWRSLGFHAEVRR
jgi:hypothetical protein